MKTKIFTPQDAKEKHRETIPEFVIEAFNSLLAEKFNNRGITITQDEAIDRILAYSKDDELRRDIIFENKWLDVEPLYRENGWEVDFDKPGFNESYKAYFTFKPKENFV